MLVALRGIGVHTQHRDLSPVPLLAQRKVRADWIFEGILCHADADVVESLLELAIEIAREGREGRRVGTVFPLGDTLGG
jgi:hypothetical protein